MKKNSTMNYCINPNKNRKIKIKNKKAIVTVTKPTMMKWISAMKIRTYLITIVLMLW